MSAAPCEWGESEVVRGVGEVWGAGKSGCDVD